MCTYFNVTYCEDCTQRSKLSCAGQEAKLSCAGQEAKLSCAGQEAKLSCAGQEGNSQLNPNISSVRVLQITVVHTESLVKGEAYILESLFSKSKSSFFSKVFLKVITKETVNRKTTLKEYWNVFDVVTKQIALLVSY